MKRDLIDQFILSVWFFLNENESILLVLFYSSLTNLVVFFSTKRLRGQLRKKVENEQPETVVTTQRNCSMQFSFFTPLDLFLCLHMVESSILFSSTHHIFFLLGRLVLLGLKVHGSTDFPIHKNVLIFLTHVVFPTALENSDTA